MTTAEFAVDRTYIGSVPPHVEEVALKTLRECWEKAHNTSAPSDGALHIVGEATVGEGMYTPGGYLVQVSYLCDERFEDLQKPTLRAYVFSDRHYKADGFLSAVGPGQEG